MEGFNLGASDWLTIAAVVVGAPAGFAALGFIVEVLTPRREAFGRSRYSDARREAVAAASHMVTFMSGLALVGFIAWSHKHHVAPWIADHLDSENRLVEWGRIILNMAYVSLIALTWTLMLWLVAKVDALRRSR